MGPHGRRVCILDDITVWITLPYTRICAGASKLPAFRTVSIAASRSKKAHGGAWQRALSRGGVVTLEEADAGAEVVAWEGRVSRVEMARARQEGGSGRGRRRCTVPSGRAGARPRHADGRARARTPDRRGRTTRARSSSSSGRGTTRGTSRSASPLRRDSACASAGARTGAGPPSCRPPRPPEGPSEPPPSLPLRLAPRSGAPTCCRPSPPAGRSNHCLSP